MRLWIDDERPIPSDFTHWALSSADAIAVLDEYRQSDDYGSLEVVSFDHDLGGTKTDDTSRPVLLWMIEHEVWPREIRAHTANPIGYDWIIGTARRYAPATTFVNPFSPYAEWM